MLVLIPARGGSKGIPGKNIKSLNGLPLISYTINEAKHTSLVTDIIVSTDNSEIAEISKQFGAKIPFMRPSELARDDSLAIDTYIYTIKRLNDEFNAAIKDFIVLQPTSPLRTAEDIDNAIRLYQEKNADSVISFTEIPHPVFWSKRIGKNGEIMDVFSGSVNQNRQKFEQLYRPNGAIYIFNYQVLESTRNYYSESSYAYIMPEEKSVDIDNPFDFKIAEMIIKQRNGKI